MPAEISSDLKVLLDPVLDKKPERSNSNSIQIPLQAYFIQRGIKQVREKPRALISHFDIYINLNV